ncbi:chromosome-associated kinesin KIF4A isoform X2 [Halyomorpha halys]|uniref:chromosome-associated kinesin KIF4A isoform X2 n=1 Tax=Halyomorpha halys TaxID=286706 RepID=UPI0006D4D8E1|nr:chromosome-associated kinesin KIF4A [Halyomorpha halys]
MDCVKVALRIRPLVSSEIDIGCRPCIERIPKEPQVTIGKGSQMFTYNFVFDELEGQGKVYNDAVQSLIDNLFKGYNVTILAYGQTGSGKTYTMGTNYSGDGELGVIPRAIYDIFNRINSSVDKEYKVSVSFIELYNESLYDLLTQKPREQSIVEMREHCNTVCIPGLTELEVNSPEETLERLKEGSSGRVVGSTAMNAQSSRSHAIFTINFKILPKDNPTNIITSKFHLVDLAGSERSKKTGTTGERFKEGVNINKGLLVLGNVISQLGEGNHGYINYRDSKLTRLLQDSLGGNSVTLMIACVSPADYNQDETLSTLRYADRARKIKNKPIVNQDPHLAEISRLRKEIEELRLKMIGGTILECPPEHKTLQEKLLDAQKKINQLSKALGSALSQNTTMFEKTISIENAESTLKEKLNDLFSYLTGSLPADDNRWMELKEKIATVQDEQKKVEKEILGLDKSSEQNNEEKDDENDDGDDDEDAASGLVNRREEHIMSQAKINKEILALSKNLMWKEELMAKLSENSGQFGKINGFSEESVEELKRQLNELQQEKDDLLKQMKNSNSGQSASAKIAENRRKRLQELEAKVSSLTKKVTEQERVIKMKEKSEEKIMALKQEIMSMKQLKVKLIQQMKSENERFSYFKAEKDREVCQLKSQNMKKQNQMKKMEQLHSMQQNVLRRKLEAAAAANKRIMAALERQKSARERKNKGPASEKIKERLTEELELLESEYQAQKSLETLMQDRAALSKELAVIKESLEDDGVSEAEKVKLRIDAKQVENELDLRSVEISDLQQKLLDIQQDDQNKHYWEVLQSMADAKFALKYLFNLASERVKENLNYASALAELKEQQSETDLQLCEYRTKLENLESYHKKALERMEKECEEKVYLFMKLASENMEKTQEGPLSEKFRIQTQELEKLEQLRKRIEELEEENKRLTKDGSDRMETENLDPFEKFLEERNTTFIVPSRKRTMKKEKKFENYTVTDEETLRAAFDDSGEIDVDDPDNDPDWRKTPIARRIHALRKGKLGKRNSGKEDEKCTCIGKCEKGCNCKKASLQCNENCSCDHSFCSLSSKRQRIDFGED